MWLTPLKYTADKKCVFRSTQNTSVIHITIDSLNMGKQYRKEPNFEILNF